MPDRVQDDGALLRLFLFFLFLSLSFLMIAWSSGRRWGDLSSRLRCGEALTQEEQKQLRRSRRNFCIWAGLSLLMAALSFFSLG